MTHPTVFGGATPPPANYQVSNSIRMNGTNTYLSRIFASGGSRQKMTISMWVKRSALNIDTNSYHTLFCAGVQSSGMNNGLKFTGSSGTDIADKLQFSCNNSVSGWNTTALYRDTSAWYQVTIAIDTTQEIESQRTRLYINGVENTSLTTESYNGQPLRNAILEAIGNNVIHTIGCFSSPTIHYFNGYIADFHYIDGQQLTPSSFGKFDANGVWVPIKYTGTYGINGCKLEFKNAGALGTDTSGNGNHWTANGLTADDQMMDSPTNNYCTWNPLTNLGGAGTLSNGNLSYLSSAGFTGQGRGTFALSSGKWHWEVTPTVGSSTFCPIIGIIDADVPNNAEVTDPNNAGYGYTYAGAIRGGGSFHSSNSTMQTGLSTISSGDIIGIDLDCDNNTIAWYKNSVQVGATQSIEKGHRWTLFVSDEGSIATVNFTLNCGQLPWSVTPASSTFRAICTANLPAVAIPQPKKHFDILLHSGTGAARTITGLTFQPDLVWAKDRSQVYNHGLFDSLRGAGNVLSSSDTPPETNYPQELTSFDVGGFSVGTGAGNFINKSGNAYVDWCWKAGGAAVTNTAGSITSQVSANPAAGFSIVTYTGNGVAGATIGHGLGAEPKMVIIKSRSNSSSNWIVRHASLTAGNDPYLYLNGLARQFDSGGQFWNNTPPSSTVVTLGSNTDVNQGAQTYVAYCFAEIPGYSKFGSYVGNFSQDGPFVFCGFRPRFILIKSSTEAGAAWSMIDTSRDVINFASKELTANAALAEVVETAGRGVCMDIISNGFKIRANAATNINDDGYTFIYAAFAEHPFGGSNVAPSPAR